MAMSPDDALAEATEAVLAELMKVYGNVAEADVRPFAQAVAQAARVAVAHVAERGEVDPSGGGGLR